MKFEEMASDIQTEALRWGIPLEEVKTLGARLQWFFERFRNKMKTKTRDTSQYGYHYLSGLLRMEAKRNYARIAREAGVGEQNMQHFMSQSPWGGRGVIEQVQEEVKAHPAFAEAVLVLDESADEKNGGKSAGSGRQHNGRLGKIEMSQVGVFAALVTPKAWVWVDGELYVPKAWFEAKNAEQRRWIGIPEGRSFQTKPELAWQLVQRLQEQGMPFVAIAMDDLYGRNQVFRTRLREADIEYYADVPKDTQVYLKKPQILYRKGKRGARRRVIHGQAYKVQQLALLSGCGVWHRLTVRTIERGMLVADFKRCRVWVLYDDKPRQEWLLIRRDARRTTYVLSNAAPDLPLEIMVWRKTHRYFIERSNEDAKSELGWDEFQALKYRGWEHHLALTILASWFIAETRLDWMDRIQRDPALLKIFQVDVLPMLSMANIRTLLQAAMPRRQLTPEEATKLVIKHLINRTRSRKSRLKKQQLRESSLPPV